MMYVCMYDVCMYVCMYVLVCMYVQGVVLKPLLAGRLQNGVMHVDESYRSSPNSVFSHRNSQFNMFYPCRRLMLLKIVFLSEGL